MFTEEELAEAKNRAKRKEANITAVWFGNFDFQEVGLPATPGYRPRAPLKSGNHPSSDVGVDTWRIAFFDISLSTFKACRVLCPYWGVQRITGVAFDFFFILFLNFKFIACWVLFHDIRRIRILPRGRILWLLTTWPRQKNYSARSKIMVR